MTSEEMLKVYRDWVFRVSAYSMAVNIISIDKLTVAPSGGNEYRDERTSFLSGELYSTYTDPSVFEILGKLKDEKSVDEDTRAGIRRYYKEISHMLALDKEEFVANEKLKNESYDAWLKAKQNNDYSIFEPYLVKLIEAKKKEYSHRNSDMNIYDQMLDDFEPGMNQEKYDAFFKALEDRLIPFIHKVTEAKPVNTSFLHKNYPVDKQKEYMNYLLQYLHFDSSWGYQNETEHPFTSWTCENDCRTTTKYIPDDVSSAILSTVHEVGHAYYEHNIDPKYDGMILSEGVSSGMHESQSRLLENYLGRSFAFWKANYPKLQETFPEQLGNVSCEEYVRAINASVPSLIRTEADELTYPLHIAIRYEIEKGLFNGTISTEGLDKTWDDMYEKYLGVRADKASAGILQDVHWSSGDFGYFPTYALGSAWAAQFVEKMKEDIPVDKLLENNRFEEIENWLKKNIHRYGCRYDADEVMLKATGKPFDVNIYLDYLCDKYTELYNL